MGKVKDVQYLIEQLMIVARTVEPGEMGEGAAQFVRDTAKEAAETLTKLVKG